MIFSLGIILLLGFIIGYLFSKIKIPGLVGMIILGMIIGPYCLCLIDDNLLNISSYLRKIALIIILTRSGLNLDIKSLKEIGLRAILLSFIPASCEIIGVSIISILVLKLTLLESLLLGSVLSAVSPAVVSPRMIKLIEEDNNINKKVPKLVLAGSSIDDIYVIVLFYIFLELNLTTNISTISILNLPISIILGITLGLIFGIIISLILNRFNFKAQINVLIILSCSFIMIGIEDILSSYISISSLLGILVLSIFILHKNKDKCLNISNSYNNLWLFFETLLFVLVGAELNYSYAFDNILISLMIIIVGLLFRTFGVYLCLIKSLYDFKERIFIMISYLPKATVQASIGSIALSNGLLCGNVILTISIISILFTAPMGSFLIDNLKYKLLNNGSNSRTIIENKNK